MTEIDEESGLRKLCSEDKLKRGACVVHCAPKRDLVYVIRQGIDVITGQKVTKMTEINVDPNAGDDYGLCV